MKTSQKFAVLVSTVLIGILAVIAIRTLTFSSKQISVPVAARVQINESRAVEHLAQGLQIKTVSYDDPAQNDYNQLVRLREYIDTQYPLIHEKLSRTVINNYSLLYEWKGTYPDEDPIILTAHLDVVPADAAEWQHDPFSGQLLNGVIWGRGAIDDKGSLFSILVAVEHLLESGYLPERTLYLAFGHDEEAGTTGGMTSARKIAEYLKQSGVHAAFVIDWSLANFQKHREIRGS